MRLNRLMLLVVALWSIVPAAGRGQDWRTQHRIFLETRARAEEGNAQAQFSLGGLYAGGKGVKRDSRRAVQWYRKAAEQGLAGAQYALALDYLHGNGVDADQAKGANWLRKAADQGMASAQLELGYCYAQGRGLDEDDVEAAKWYRRAAQQASPDAQYRLGVCYLTGTGVARDTAEAIKWIRTAARQGFGLAQEKLGVCYEKGHGVSRDYLTAYKWLNLAAGQAGEESWDAKVELAKVESHLTPAQVAAAQQWDSDFRPGQDRSSQSGLTSPGSADAPGASDHARPNGAASAPGSQAGFIDVKAVEEGGDIFVDGAFVGNSPAKVRLGAGKHTIEIREPGFKVYKREIMVSAGSELTLRPALTKE
jgi:uncharacterized protein